MNNTEYKNFLIKGIIEFQTDNIFTVEELKSKSIRVLERIYDNV